MSEVDATSNGHVPGMHDPVAKAALLKKTNDEMRKRIEALKKEVEAERNSSKRTHEEKVLKLKTQQDNAEVC